MKLILTLIVLLSINSCTTSNYLREGTYSLEVIIPHLYYDNYVFKDNKGHRIIIKSTEDNKYYWTDSIIISRKINK